MKLETFFEKFDLFADAPGAMAKMRELVLELAVRGKLVEQEAGEGSSTEAQRRGELFDENAVPYAIPMGWRWTTLESLGDTKPRNDVADDIKTSFIPMTLIPANYGQRVGHEVRLWEEIKKGYTHFQDGDVVMAKITPCFENGKSAVISGLTGGIGAGTTELHVFRRNGTEILPEFVIIFLKSRSYILRGLPRMTGSAGQKRIPYYYFARAPFPLPPLAEQKRIVAKVDELMALCDRLEAEQKEREEKKAALIRASLARFAKAPTPANLNYLFHKSYDIAPADLRKTILTLAIQGKLVPQNALEPSAKEILCKIEEMRGLKGEKSKTRKLESFSPVIHEDEPFKIPNEWRWCRLGTLGLIGSSYRVHEKDWTTNGVPFFRAREIVKLSKSGQVDNDLFITEEHYQLLASTGLIPEQNDIMITGVGTIGVPYVVRETDRFYFKDASVLIFKNCFGLYPFYLHMMMLSPYWNREIHRGSMGTTVHTLTIVRIKQTPIPLPPLAEQRRIVAKVGQLMALVDELEEQLAASCASGEKLLVALVAELTTLRKAPSTP